MQTFRNITHIPADFAATIASVGNFDGVHRAHQQVLKHVVERARHENAKAVAVTFDPHPVRILRPDVAPKLITPTPEKLRLLEQTGIDAAVVLPFTRDFSIIRAREFARMLRNQLKAIEVHEGANFRFGHGAAGTVEQLSALGSELGFAVKIYPELRIHGDVVSSSRIRELLQQGKVSRARALLGRVFSVHAHPGRGRGYGRKYTVPTINLEHYDELLPANGVYATRTRVAREIFDSVTNVGNRPTFGAESFAVESHLLNFHPIEINADTEIEIFFFRRLRDEIKFPSVEALRAQIGKDVARARRYLGRAPNAC
jgi:riboflavin kinase/FMN adenylyltransferase